jgi:hypothetical protein
LVLGGYIVNKYSFSTLFLTMGIVQIVAALIKRGFCLIYRKYGGQRDLGVVHYLKHLFWGVPEKAGLK